VSDYDFGGVIKALLIGYALSAFCAGVVVGLIIAAAL
jgi:hypothetical protein